MKIRQLKQTKMAAMFASGRLVPSALGIGNYLPVRDEVLFAMDHISSMLSMDLRNITQAVAGGPVVAHDVYVVSRVKDGEVVLETEDRSEALALINKHAKQKKAKLHAHVNGVAVLFSEEEV